MRRPLFVVCLCLVAIAAVRLWWYDSRCPKEALFPAEDEVITVTGEVYQKDATSFVMQPFYFSGAGDSRQNIPFEQKLICEFGEEMAWSMPEIGSVVTLQGTYRCFLHATNPGEFDVAGYYETLGICGKVTEITDFWQGEEYSVVRETLYQLRTAFKERMYMVFPRKEASVLTAMLLGDKDGLDEGVEELYKENGIIHILSISGLHITMIGMGIYQLLRRAGMPVWLAAICGGGILCLYGVMTGLSVSACRAIGMYLIRMLAEVVGRTYDMLTALGVIAAIMAWHNPMNLYNVGFLLSFGSIMGIGWFYPAILPKGKKRKPQRYEPRRWKLLVRKWIQQVSQKGVQSILASTSITLFTLPIQLWFYYEVPTYSVIVNLLILPVMNLLMITGLVVVLLPGSGILGTVTCLILQVCEMVCKWFEQLPMHTWNPGRPQWWQVVAYYILLVVVVIGSKEDSIGKKLRKPIVLTVAVIVLVVRVSAGTTVTFLDVGQGECIVMQMASGEVFLFDCGSTSRKQVGKYVLLPFLKYNGIGHIDGIFVSHEDEDHVSGLKELFSCAKEEGIVIDRILLPDIRERSVEGMNSLQSLLQESEAELAYLSEGFTFATEGASFLCVHPPAGYGAEDRNTGSLCCYIAFDKEGNASDAFSLLLTGDVGGEGEQLLMQELKNRDISDVTILKVAHHGSGYSSAEEFLAVVKPQLSIISCGRNNSYGHPHPETLERLERVGSATLATPQCGAVTVHMEKGKLWVEAFGELP